MPAAPELEVERLLGTLTSYGVDYVVIGGIAAVLWGSPSSTWDVDICPATDAGNLDALGRAAGELGAQIPEPNGRVRLVTQAGQLDLLMGPPDFERLRLNAERMNLGAFSALVASIPDLIAMKRSAGRPKDEVDIDELLAIERVARRLED